MVDAKQVEKNFRKDTGFFTRFKALLKLSLLFDKASWERYKTKCEYWSNYYERQALKQIELLKQAKVNAGIEKAPKFDIIKHYEKIIQNPEMIKDPILKTLVEVGGPLLLHKYKTELDIIQEDSEISNDVLPPDGNSLRKPSPPLNNPREMEEAINNLSGMTTKQLSELKPEELQDLSYKAGKPMSILKIKLAQKKMKEFLNSGKEESININPELRKLDVKSNGITDINKNSNFSST